MPEATARTFLEGEHFVHKELWKVVERQLEHAAANPTGSFYDNLAAITFASLFIEGYLNFVGQLLAPAFWKDERKHFSKVGFLGKLRKVLELADVHVDESARPFSTIRKLQRLRDRIVHARPEKITESVHHHPGALPDFQHAPLNALLTKQETERFVTDVRELAETIHASVRRKAHSPWLGTSPFGGITMHVSGHTELARPVVTNV